MALVVLMLCFNCLLVARFLRGQWQHTRDPQAHPLARRLPGGAVIGFGVRQLLLAAVLIYAWHVGAWDAASVGVHHPGLWLESILAGEVGFLALIVGYSLLLWLGRRMPAMRLAAIRGNLRIWPRQRSLKILATIFFVVFNPFTEELVMRGILIHQWGLLLGSPVLPIVVGFVLNALLHWYQGWRMQFWHALFFAVAVSLLYSRWGLIAAITAHVFGDLVPVINLRRQLLRARTEQRKARAARASSKA
jgi:membrane protease YdiL (CAAX protease family)